jgi:hypothetical protein
LFNSNDVFQFKFDTIEEEKIDHSNNKNQQTFNKSSDQQKSFNKFTKVYTDESKSDVNKSRLSDIKNKIDFLPDEYEEEITAALAYFRCPNKRPEVIRDEWEKSRSGLVEVNFKFICFKTTTVINCIK